MTISLDQLDSICRIPRSASRQSMSRLVTATGYRELRPALSRELVAEYLARHPDRVREWLRYSQDKRASGGWYLLHLSSGWVVGRLSGEEQERELRFGSGPEACAEFILRELDSVAGDPVGTQRSE